MENTLWQKIRCIIYCNKNGHIEETQETAPGVNLEFNEQHELSGIEILDASRFLKPVLKPMEERILVNA